MKHLFYLSVLILLTFSSCQAQDRSKTIPTSETSISKIELIDFYGKRRCVTCEAIEANAKYTIDHYFPEEKAKGTVSFKTVNVDQKENYGMAERFEASGTALFINVIHNGSEKHIDLTNFAFMKGKDKEAFSKALKAKIDAELKNL